MSVPTLLDLVKGLSITIVPIIVTYVLTRRKYVSDANKIDAETDGIESNTKIKEFSILVDNWKKIAETHQDRYENLIIEYQKLINDFTEFKKTSDTLIGAHEEQIRVLKVEIRVIREENLLIKEQNDLLRKNIS